MEDGTSSTVGKIKIQVELQIKIPPTHKED